MFVHPASLSQTALHTSGSTQPTWSAKEVSQCASLECMQRYWYYRKEIKIFEKLLMKRSERVLWSTCSFLTPLQHVKFSKSLQTPNLWIESCWSSRETPWWTEAGSSGRPPEWTLPSRDACSWRPTTVGPAPSTYTKQAWWVRHGRTVINWFN